MAYYQRVDWLGSARLDTSSSGGVNYDGAYAAYGENYAQIGTLDHEFAGMPQQQVTTGSYPLQDALFRNYNPVWGRWLSPDPAGVAAANPMNPQSWNRYAYALNNPAIFVDPMGLQSSGGSGCVDAYECPQDVPQCDIEGDPWGGSITCTGWVISITVYATPIPPPGIFDASLSEGFVVEGDPMTAGAGGSGGGGSNGRTITASLVYYCYSQADKKNEFALSLDVAGVGAGFLPGGDAVVAVAGMGLSTAGAIYAGAHNDSTGVNLNGAAFTVSALTPTAKAIGGDIAKSVPVLGAFISAAGGLDDLWNTYRDYRSCMAGH